jgi:metal-sulfur cluster biosynthetic enzyme
MKLRVHTGIARLAQSLLVAAALTGCKTSTTVEMKMNVGPDPEIPLNIVDLGLVYEVAVLPDAVNVKVSMTSPACPSHVAISEDIKVKLADAGFPNPRVEVVWEPAWSPQRISEKGRKALGI